MSSNRRRRPEYQAPAYLKAVKAFLDATPVVPGEVTELAVQHDDDCGVFRGRACGCNPTVTTLRDHRRSVAERN